MSEVEIDMGGVCSELLYNEGEHSLDLTVLSDAEMTIGEAFEALFQQVKNPVIRSAYFDLGKSGSLSDIPFRILKGLEILWVFGRGEINLNELLAVSASSLSELNVTCDAIFDCKLPSLKTLVCPVSKGTSDILDFCKFPNLLHLGVTIKGDETPKIESSTLRSLSLGFDEKSDLNLDLLDVKELTTLKLGGVKKLIGSLSAKKLERVSIEGSPQLEKYTSKFPDDCQIVKFSRAY